jgi:K+-sensing histidine kinase KdpD
MSKVTERKLLITTKTSAANNLVVEVQDTEPERAEGMGMGLAICRSIVEAPAAKCRCVPANEWQGAVFRFTLPTQGLL